MNQILAFILVLIVLAYLAVELGWGGGNPNDPNHTTPPGGSGN